MGRANVGSCGEGGGGGGGGARTAARGERSRNVGDERRSDRPRTSTNY